MQALTGCAELVTGRERGLALTLKKHPRLVELVADRQRHTELGAGALVGVRRSNARLGLDRVRISEQLHSVAVRPDEHLIGAGERQSPREQSWLVEVIGQADRPPGKRQCPRLVLCLYDV